MAPAVRTERHREKCRFWRMLNHLESLDSEHGYLNVERRIHKKREEKKIQSQKTTGFKKWTMD